MPSSRDLILSLGLCAALAAPAARSAGTAPGPGQTAVEREDREGPDADDPFRRLQWRRESEERYPAGARVRHLLAARAERDKLGLVDQNLLRDSVRRGAQRVPGSVWINIGPGRSDYNTNSGITYVSTDSGRLRTILPHPSDPNLLYVAASGGGVWKTYDAGQSWVPLTDAAGSTSVGALAMDPRNPDILYLGFGDPYDLPQPGVIMTTDGGATWSDPVFLTGKYVNAQKAQDSTLVSQVMDLKVDPDDSSHLLLAADLGLFQSNDAGKTWSQVTPLPGVISYVFAWSIAHTGKGSWLVAGQNCDSSLVPPGNAPAGEPEKLVLWQSIDSGKTWTDASGGLPASSLGRATLAVVPSTVGGPAGARVYMIAAAPDGLSTGNAFRSDDGGTTWQALGVNAQGTPTNPNGVSGAPTLALVTLDVLHGQAWYNQMIGTDPLDPNVVFIGGQYGMIRSTNAGRSWSYVGDWLPPIYLNPLPYVHADFHAMAASAAGGTVRYYVGNDGGIFSSADLKDAPPNGVHFNDLLNVGLTSHLVYSIACASPGWPQSLQGFVLGGLQDNGTRRRSLASAGGPDTFDGVMGGDGTGAAASGRLDPTGTLPALVLASLPGGQIFASTDGGLTFPSQFANINNGPFNTPVVADVAAADGATFLSFSTANGASSAVVYRAKGGGGFDPINGTIHAADGSVISGFNHFAGVANARHLDVHPKVSGIYGFVLSGGASYVTADGGQNWTGGKPAGSNASRPDAFTNTLTSIAFDLADTTGQKLWLSSAASNVLSLADAIAGVNTIGKPITEDFGHLWYTSDGGKNWQTVAGAAGHKLPNVPIQRIQVDPSDGDTLYVATDAGMYRSSDHGASFDRFGVGLPLVQVGDFCITSSSVKVATFGRGFWEIDTGVGGLVAGVRGHGDLDFNRRLDAFDLIDLVAAMGTTNASDKYRPEADLTGTTNQIDDDDLKLFLSRFGGAP